MNRHGLRFVLMSIICFFSAGMPTSVFAFNYNFGQIIHRKNSLYNSIFVYQSGPVRTLQFGRRQSFIVESQVNMDDPHLHMLEYTRMAFSGLLYNSEPNNMLVLGLGGGVIPRQMRYYYPAMKIDIAEIDRAIPPIATRFFGFQPDDRMKVHVGDGRVFIKKQLRLDPAPQYDIIVLDAFNSDYIPFHLMTKEFLEELKGVLSSNGVVVANVFYTNRLFDAEFKTFLDVFGRCQVFFGESSDNAMLVSPAPARPLLTASEAVLKAAQLQDKLGLSFDFVRIAKQLAPDEKPDPRAKTLTDDLAPVNWLRNQKTQTSSRR